MLTIALLAILASGPTLPQASVSELPPDLRRISALPEPAKGIVDFFLRDPSRTFAESAIPADTKAFSKNALDTHLRTPLPSAVTWKGYFTPDGLAEVMCGAWSNATGSYIWLDNGAQATLRWVLSNPEDLTDEETSLRFVNRTIESVLKTPSVPLGRIRHWLKPSPVDPKIWNGILDRDVTVQEEVTTGGRRLFKVLGAVEWHQHFTVATDGRSYIVQFRLKEAQKNPHGNMRRSDTYLPFRFSDQG